MPVALLMPTVYPMETPTPAPTGDSNRAGLSSWDMRDTTTPDHNRHQHFFYKMQRDDKCFQPGCSRRPTCGYRSTVGKRSGPTVGRRAIACTLHRKEGMIDVSTRAPLCAYPGCMTQPTFGNEGSRRATFCATHKEPGMVDVKSMLCLHASCR